ncbi:MAG: DUF2098 domain-containing protein [Candidatus Verstraetearchaeota archaeon]|nr:DUF2098 domain-containing protein [Candidatus Verstraetearchaeota archaeon]
MAIKEGEGVVYNKTGTIGRVVRLLKMDGKVWAEVDSTGLLYDVNVLEPASVAAVEKEKEGKEKEGKKREEMKRPAGVEDMKDEGTLDSTAGICGAG